VSRGLGRGGLTTTKAITNGYGTDAPRALGEHPALGGMLHRGARRRRPEETPAPLRLGVTSHAVKAAAGTGFTEEGKLREGLKRKQKQSSSAARLTLLCIAILAYWAVAEARLPPRSSSSACSQQNEVRR